MFNYCTSNCTNLPLERLNQTTNKSLYIKRFKEMAWKYFCVINNRLYYIKFLKNKRNEDGQPKKTMKILLKKFHIFTRYIHILKNYMIIIFMHQKIV